MFEDLINSAMATVSHVAVAACSASLRPERG